MIKETFDLLGLRMKDRITGMVGVVTSVTFDLYGCVQVILNPGVDNDGKPRDGMWFDVKRLVLASNDDNKPVIDVPDFGQRAFNPVAPRPAFGSEAGPETKPLPPGQ